MGSRLFLLVAIFVICLSQVSSDAEIEDHQSQIVRGANRRMMLLMDCDKLCTVRCGVHSRPKVCTRACGTCCVRCKCVPPGTSGNRELCGTCYTNMTTHGNRTKCP
ncbi:hypothetical protein Leryth_009936 [Lithospermum erythrorhizon]|nr:hypothetical protein Leryth_009936 [Lithospermum erythrorhizon]